MLERDWAGCPITRRSPRGTTRRRPAAP